MANNNAVNTTLTGQSGSGAFAGNISPSFTTPALGVATATSVNFGQTNSLNYYDIGTFTPTFRFQTSTPTVTYTSQVGNYVRIGKLVFIDIELIFNPATVTAASTAWVAGLPFANSTQQNGIQLWSANMTGMTAPTGGIWLAGSITNSSTNISMQAMGFGASPGFLTGSTITASTTYLWRMSGCYYVP